MQISGHQREYDAVIVGSGPNGLAAGITIAAAGHSVLIIERAEQIGGGTRTEELTEPGLLHDVCSAIHPMAAASPLFRTLPLEQYGLKWIEPPAALAHPLDDGPPAVLVRDVTATSESLMEDAAAYRRLMTPLVARGQTLFEDFLGPLKFPRHPLLSARFGLRALQSASGFSRRTFRGERGQALLAGIAAHSILPLEMLSSAAVGLMLGIAGHCVGWPLPEGGSQRIATALAGYFQSLGGEIITGQEVERIEQLPPHRVALFDLTPRQLLQIAGDKLSASDQRQMKAFRHGPGSFKVDYALSGPIPWKNPECAMAGTVHLGGTLAEIADSERLLWQDRLSDRPFVLLAQQSLFDPTRTLPGRQVAWAYCHVPHAYPGDATELIERQIERFAPGFQDCIVARSVRGPAALEAYNPNYIGGDISGGAQLLSQLFTRPTWRWRPYRTSNRQIYLCSSSTPPGGGVHGMCGYYAATEALRRCLA